MAASPYLSIDIDAQRKLVRISRTSVPIPTVESVLDMVAHVRHTLAGLNRGEHGLLVDLRSALISDESKYSDAMAALRRELVSRFRKAAMLVGTRVGYLQVQRFLREENLTAKVFDEAEAAELYLGS
jgi:hypothetical protein